MLTTLSITSRNQGQIYENYETLCTEAIACHEAITVAFSFKWVLAPFAALNRKPLAQTSKPAPSFPGR